MDENSLIQQQIKGLAEAQIDLKSQLVAAQLAIRTLLLTHPDRDAAIATMSTELERWAGHGLNTLLPDSSLEAFERAIGMLLPCAADLQRVP